MNTAGLVFDVYDDTDKHLLSAFFREVAPPEKVASSTLLSHEELDLLPNHVFAVVADNGNGAPFRKYAMHDEPHLKVSVLYFCETGHLFPEGVQKIAARNLVRGCRWYDVDPPETLVKIAFGGCEKVADLAGTEVMPRGALKQAPTKKSGVKTASLKYAAVAVADRFIDDTWEESGDISGFSGHTTVKEAKYEHFCLPHTKQYPIDSYELVKRADDYFCEHVGEFPYPERRMYAQNLSQRASDIGIEVSEKVAAYTGHKYGTHIVEELVKRASAYEGTGHEVGYEALLARKDEIPPAAMALLIKEADEKTGADRVYNRDVTGFRDPYRAVFDGSREVKLAWAWDREGLELTEDQLADFAKVSSAELDGIFGNGFGDSFARDPVGIFDSMPAPQKMVIAKLAQRG